jgi:hypothetical protein
VEVPTLGLGILLDRLHQGMAEDRLIWCEDRIDQMWPLDRLQAAARYYHARIKERVPLEERRRVKIDARLRAIEDRLDAAITIENGASATRIRAALRGSRITNDKRYERYQHDAGRLAGLLRHDAEQDLIRLLSVGYTVGCYQLAVFRVPTREPSLSKPRPHP